MRRDEAVFQVANSKSETLTSGKHSNSSNRPISSSSTSSRKYAFRSRRCVMIAQHVAQKSVLTQHTAGTNPIHNKAPKKVKKELDEDELAFKAKQQAGT
jgi:hypothetical protein